MTINTYNHNLNHSGCPQKTQQCQDYIHALEDERRKIQVFQRELPLCLDLVTKAIEACKQQLLSGATAEYNLNAPSECSEQTTSDAPVLEEFIPLKSREEQESKEPNNIDEDGDDCNEKNCKKSDWLRSVQLWNQTPDPPSNQDSPKEVDVVEVNRNGSGCAFHPFRKEKVQVGTSDAPVVPPASTSSSAETGGGSDGNKKVDKEKESQRKSRRCWSAELHRKFLQALEQLGGSHLATPKQIKELMKVEGLTNDEVKSHLQKYRLHTRRPNPSAQNICNSQTPQFVVVGGIWVPPEYAASATATNRIYTPVPKPPHSEERGSRSEAALRSRSHSSATSSSTYTTTASPVH